MLRCETQEELAPPWIRRICLVPHIAVVAWMAPEETYRRTLEYALGIVGGELALSTRLKVPLGTLRNWLGGITPIPDAAFLDTVDVIVKATPDEIARSRLSLLKQSSGSPGSEA